MLFVVIFTSKVMSNKDLKPSVRVKKNAFEIAREAGWDGEIAFTAMDEAVLEELDDIDNRLRAAAL